MIDDIFKAYYLPLRNYAFKIIGDENDAEDVIQELFISLWQKDQWSSIKNIEAYLLRAVKFKCIDVLRKNQLNAIVSIEGHTEKMADQSPMSNLEEYEATLIYIMSKLPPKTRKVFEMSRIDDMSYKEIADFTGTSIKTVENQIGHALKIIRSTLSSIPDQLIVMFVNFFRFSV